MEANAGADDGVHEALRSLAAARSAGHATGRGRITASSFKLLTERLKRKPGEALPDIPDLIVSAEVTPPLPETGHESLPELAARPALHDLPFSESVEAPAAEPTAAMPADDVEAEAMAGAASFPQFNLPAFAPLAPKMQEAEAEPAVEAEFQPLAAQEVVEHGPVDDLAESPAIEFPEEAPAAAAAIDAAADLPDDIPAWPSLPEFAPIAVAAAPELELEREPEPSQPQDMADEAEALESAAPEEVRPAEMLEPIVSEIAPEVDVPADSAEVLTAEPLPAPEPVPFELTAEPEEILAAYVADQPFAPVEAEEAAEIAPAREGESAPEAVVAADAGASITAETAVEANEPKHASPVAGRVVDAMLKTISDSIYSKPSATERAAFLRDMAELMTQEAANITEPQAAAPAITPVAEPKPVAKAAVTAAPVASQPAALAPAPVNEPEPLPLNNVLAARMGPASALLKSAGGEPDLFAKDVSKLALSESRPAESAAADEETGDLALTLLDMMSAGAGTALPQERALAADTLLRILSRIPIKQLLAVVERVAIMQAPPPLLVAKLIRDPRPEVVAPLLERCMHITDQDLMTAASEGDVPKQRMIARRRVLSPVLADHLIALGDPSVVLTLIRNPAAAFSHDAFYVLADLASQHHGLLAPLATRADLPPPVAFELFWFVPQELRRFIFSRFLTDSETLNKILRITLATHGGSEGDVAGGEAKFPDRAVIEGAIAHAAGFRLDEAARILSEAAAVSKDTAMRILADREGEPLTVILKALGYPRGKFAEAMEGLKSSEAGILRSERVVEELQSIFDSLSFNKARILLTYWDWFVRKAGPYAPRH